MKRFCVFISLLPDATASSRLDAVHCVISACSVSWDRDDAGTFIRFWSTFDRPSIVAGIMSAIDPRNDTMLLGLLGPDEDIAAAPFNDNADIGGIRPRRKVKAVPRRAERKDS